MREMPGLWKILLKFCSLRAPCRRVLGFARSMARPLGPKLPAIWWKPDAHRAL